MNKRRTLCTPLGALAILASAPLAYGTDSKAVPGNLADLEVTKVSGDQETGIFGSVIEPVVRVTSNGEPVVSAQVRFTVSSGAGTLADTLVVTGSDGTARTLWLLGPTVGGQALNVEVGGSFTTFTAEATEPVPGQVYHGRNRYVEYVPGELPIILASPHGGGIRPAEIPDRTKGTFARDMATTDLTRRIANALERLTGKRPHVAFSHLRRVKLDPNRDIDVATQGNPHAMRAWHEYHTWLDRAGDIVTRDHGRGLLLDIHGHAHPIQRIELGYMLRSADLNRPDSDLDRQTFIDRSSIRNLANTSPLTLSEIVRGEDSLGEILVRNGYPAIPSKSDPRPEGDPFFSHGYTLLRHGSRDGGVVEAIMIEHNRELRYEAEVREEYANALALSIVEYMEKHFGVMIPRASQTD